MGFRIWKLEWNNINIGPPPEIWIEMRIRITIQTNKWYIKTILNESEVSKKKKHRTQQKNKYKNSSNNILSTDIELSLRCVFHILLLQTIQKILFMCMITNVNVNHRFVSFPNICARWKIQICLCEEFWKMKKYRCFYFSYNRIGWTVFIQQSNCIDRIPVTQYVELTKLKSTKTINKACAIQIFIHFWLCFILAICIMFWWNSVNTKNSLESGFID